MGYFNSSHNTSLKERLNKDLNKESHWQISKMETHRQTNEQTDGRVEKSKIVQLDNRGHQSSTSRYFKWVKVNMKMVN